MFPSETNGLSGMAIPLRLIEQLYAFFKEFPSVLALNTSMKWKMETKQLSDSNSTSLFSILDCYFRIKVAKVVEKTSDESRIVHLWMDNYRRRDLKFICLTVGWIGLLSSLLGTTTFPLVLRKKLKFQPVVRRNTFDFY